METGMKSRSFIWGKQENENALIHLHPLQGQKINQENFLKILKLEMQKTTVLQFEVLRVEANFDNKSTFDSHPHFQLCSLCLKVKLLPHILYLAGHQ